MKIHLTKSKILTAVFSISLPLISLANSLNQDFDIDVSKTTETLKGQRQETDRMTFTITMRRTGVNIVHSKLSAEFFVFATKPLTDEVVLHHTKIIDSVSFENGNFSAESNPIDFRNLNGSKPANVDREYKGFLVRLVDDSGNVLAVRTTHPQFEEKFNVNQKVADEIVGSWEHTVNKGIITFEKTGRVLATYDKHKGRRWGHIEGNKYSYTGTKGEQITLIIKGDTMLFVEQNKTFKKIK